MKKMNKKLFLASVFFCLLILIGCGIATIFYINAYINTSTKETNIVSGDFIVNSDENTTTSLEMISEGTGPSLMFFYVLSSSNTIPSGSIINRFSSTYVNKPNGKNISPNTSNPILLTVTDSIDYNLIAFSDRDTTLFKAPYYIATASIPTNYGLSFSLSRNVDMNDKYYLTLSIDNTSDTYTIHAINNNLTRYNGTNFLSSISDINNSSLADYVSVIADSIENSTYYCHVFAAMSVAKGTFGNIYWTSLAYLGAISLPTTTT